VESELGITEVGSKRAVNLGPFRVEYDEGYPVEYSDTDDDSDKNKWVGLDEAQVRALKRDLTALVARWDEEDKDHG
jgi:hypothetical protein